MREEDLEKLAKEGKLQDTLKELKELSETCKKMADEHESILSSYTSIRSGVAESMEAMIEKEKELLNTFQRDIKQIEDYLVKKKQGR